MSTYENDQTFKEQYGKLEEDMQELRESIDNAADSGSKNLSAESNALWENIQKNYHHLMSYLKDTFNVEEEDIVTHKMKEATHYMKEKGYEVKSDR